jgi:hypothetical protein
MSLFGKLVRTVVNTAALPVAVVQDVVTLGGVSSKEGVSFTLKRLQQLKDEAED